MTNINQNTPPNAPSTDLSDLVTMYQRTADIWRESATEWRKLAATMPAGLAALALRNAEVDDQNAQADLLRAETLNKSQTKQNSY